MRHTNYRMEIKFRQQFLFDCDFCVIRTKQKSVGKNNRRPSVIFQAIHNDGHKQISRFTACQIGRKVIFNICLFISTIRRVHKNHFKFVFIRVVQNVAKERIIVINSRHIDIVQQKICYTKHIRKLFLFDTVNGIFIGFNVICRCSLFL